MENNFLQNSLFFQTFQTWNRVNILASLTMKLSYAGEMLETNFNSASRRRASHKQNWVKRKQGRLCEVDWFPGQDDSYKMYLFALPNI